MSVEFSIVRSSYSGFVEEADCPRWDRQGRQGAREELQVEQQGSCCCRAQLGGWKPAGGSVTRAMWTLGSRTLKFMATDLWVGAPKEARVVIVIDDLGEFIFRKNYHYSEWTDSDVFNLKVFKNKEMEEMDPTEQGEVGIGSISMRLCLTPTCIGAVTATMGAIPQGLEEAMEAFPRMNEASCPQVNLPMEGRSKGTMFKLVPVEEKKDGVGIGVFGFLAYLTAAVTPRLPSIVEWKEATVLFLRKAVSFNNKSANSIMDKLKVNDEFEKDSDPKRIWPMPKESTGESSRPQGSGQTGENSSGWNFCY